MVAPAEMDTLLRMDPRLALMMPQVEVLAARLGLHLASGDFPLLGASLARLVTLELTSPRRLRPADPAGEIDILRLLAMALTASAGRLLTLEDGPDRLHRTLQEPRHGRFRRRLRQSLMVRAINAAGMRPIIDRHFPLSEIADAFKYQETNQHFGKIVLDI